MVAILWCFDWLSCVVLAWWLVVPCQRHASAACNGSFMLPTWWFFVWLAMLWFYFDMFGWLHPCGLRWGFGAIHHGGLTGVVLANGWVDVALQILAEVALANGC